MEWAKAMASSELEKVKVNWLMFEPWDEVVESEERSTREEEELTEEVENEVDSPGREPERANSLNIALFFTPNSC